MLTKIIPYNSYSYGEQVFEMIKLSSRGLIGDDRKRLIKRAGERFVDELPLEKLAKGEVPVHMLAMGTTEHYGSNRNGDGFREKILEEYHPTFVKLARCYRNHQNRDKAKSYGRVIKSAFYRPMHRVELLVGLNGTEEAARANGGLLADEELEDLEKHGSYDASMACKVSHDVCSGCDNRARTRAEYCGPEQCTKYGGLRDHIAETFADGHTLHADNPDPHFIDISKVPRGADRIAAALGVLQKSAMARRPTVSGAELAERYGLSSYDPEHISGIRTLRKQAIAERLAELEKSAVIGDQWSLANHDAVRAVPVKFPDAQYRDLFSALALAKVALSLPDFLRLVAPTEKQANEAYSAVAERLPGIYQRLSLTGDFGSHYDPSDRYPTRNLRDWAYKLAASRGLGHASAQSRLLLAALRGATPYGPAGQLKEASATPGAEALALEFARYRVAALAAMDDGDGEARVRELLTVRER